MAELFDGLERSSSSNGYVLLIQGYPDSELKSIEGLSVPNVFGVSAPRIKSFLEDVEHLKASNFVYSLLANQRRHEFVLRSYATSRDGLGDLTYNDEFVRLHGREECWICAVPLKAKDPGEPERSLLAFYPVPDFDNSTRLPQGAEIEWDAIELVPDIFAVLQNKVKSLQEQVEEDQKLLIADLAPSAIAHEMGTNLNLILSSLSRVTNPLRELLAKNGEDDASLQEVIEELLGIRNRATKAQKVASAFTNLQRKVPRSEILVEQLLEEIEVVLSQRLGGVGITLVIDVPAGLSVKTDVRFLEHVLMNVIINAIEAIEPEVAKEGGNSEINVGSDRFDPKIMVLAMRSDDEIVFFLGNNGPEIPPEISPRVFEQGVTSKPTGTGHGQGLHLCRQIAIHLGGNFGFGKFPNHTEFSPSVVFELRIPVDPIHSSDS